MTKTIYQETSRSRTEANAIKNQQPMTNKVNRICEAFLTVLLPKLSTNLQNVVTAYVCKSPPDLDHALLLIGRLKRMLVLKDYDKTILSTEQMMT